MSAETPPRGHRAEDSPSPAPRGVDGDLLEVQGPRYDHVEDVNAGILAIFDPVRIEDGEQTWIESDTWVPIEAGTTAEHPPSPAHRIDRVALGDDEFVAVRARADDGGWRVVGLGLDKATALRDAARNRGERQ